MSIAPCIVGRSESLPMITPTSGLPTGVTLMDTESVHTRLTEMLGIEHPVMLAGMGGVSYHRLVAAVSEAGGFGCMGASTMSPEKMVAEIEAVKGLTAKPFGVDLLTALPAGMLDQVGRLIDGGASVFVAG